MGFSGHKGWTYHHNGVFDVQHLRDACFYGHLCGACVVVRVFFFPVRVAERRLDVPEVYLVVLVRPWSSCRFRNKVARVRICWAVQASSPVIIIICCYFLLLITTADGDTTQSRCLRHLNAAVSLYDVVVCNNSYY